MIEILCFIAGAFAASRYPEVAKDVNVFVGKAVKYLTDRMQ